MSQYPSFFRFLGAAVVVAVFLLAIFVAIWLLDSLFSVTSSLTLQKIKTTTEIVNNVVIAAGVIVGGVWAYYKFARGRLFAPRIDIGLSQQTIVQDDHQLVIFVEVRIENIGSIRVRPQMCHIKVLGLKVDDKGITEHQITSGQIKSPAKPNALWYIEPSEVDFRAESVVIPKDFQAITISVTVNYDKGYQSYRVFSVSLPGN